MQNNGMIFKIFYVLLPARLLIMQGFSPMKFGILLGKTTGFSCKNRNFTGKFLQVLENLLSLRLLSDGNMPRPCVRGVAQSG